MCAEVTIVQKINESLREHGMKIINFKKFIKLLTNKQQELYENAKTCYICKVKFEENIFQIKKYCKVRNHYHYTGEYRGAAHSIYNLKYSLP